MALVVRLDKSAFDRAALAAPIEGKLYEGRIARTHAPGDPLVYGPNDYEYRNADELAKILDHIVGQPITLLHPSGLIRDGAEAVVVGRIIGARIDDDTLVAEIFITDSRGIVAIEGGVVELSMGYTANVTADSYQTDIHVDHVAIVPAARCGAACALRADSVEKSNTCGCGTTDGKVVTTPVAVTHDGCPCGGAVQETCQCKNHAVYSASMTLDEIQKQLDETKAALDAALKRASDAEAALKAKADSAVTSQIELDNAKKDLKVAQDALDAEKARADQAVKDGEAAVVKAKADADAEFQAKLDAAVTKRAKVLTDAVTVLGATDDTGATIDYTKKDNREIKVAIIKHVDGDDVADDALEAYVDGMYEGALRRFAKAGASKAAARETLATTRKDSSETIPTTGLEAEKAAADEFKRRNSTAWASSKN